MRRNRLIGKPANLDPLTDFSLLAWDTFSAREFPLDEARRLALAVGGLDVPELANAAIVEAKKGMVRIRRPSERVRRGGDQERPGVRVDAESFGTTIDAVHTVLYVADLDGLAAAKSFMDGHSLTNDPDFLNCVRGLVNAIPRTKASGGWLYGEAELLDRLCVAYLPDIPLPANPVEKAIWTQISIAGPPEGG